MLGISGSLGKIREPVRVTTEYEIELAIKSLILFLPKREIKSGKLIDKFIL